MPFRLLVGPLNTFFGKISVIDPLPIFFIIVFMFLLLSCTNSLCVSDVNPLSDVWLANMFFHSTGCLFILLMVSLAVQMLVSLL